MSSKLLIKHCQLSWEIAVQNCKLIIDGLVDLSQQKSFISSFQNAIELGTKQIMIDECYYSVVDYSAKKMDTAIAQNYLQSNDLNAYFISLSKEELGKLFSIEFNEIIDIFSKKVKLEKGTLIKEKLNILKKLRNNETHFYIDDANYLSFDNFEKLCELMDFFYNYFCEKNVIAHGFGKPSDDWKTNLGYFKKSDYTFVSYDELISNSVSNKKILNNFTTFNPNDICDGYHFSLYNENDDYGIAYSVYTAEDLTVDMKFGLNFNEFYRRFSILKEKGYLIVNTYVDDEAEEYYDDEGIITVKPPYASIVVTKK